MPVQKDFRKEKKDGYGEYLRKMSQRINRKDTREDYNLNGNSQNIDDIAILESSMIF